MIEKDKSGNAKLAAFLPSKEVQDLTRDIQSDYQVAYDLQHQPFTEFNDYSLLDRADLDQKRWNAYRDPASSDPDEAWRWNGVRTDTRNKIIGIVAQMTSKIYIPAPSAQNDKDEEDRVSAQVMRDLMEYNVRNSNYVDNYIQWITDGLVNPASYMGVGFFEVMQTIRSKDEETGKVSKKEVIDGILSGFQTYNIPVDEILISNFYQKDLNRQRFVFRRRYIDYDEAKALYHDHENWEYVVPGVKNVFSADDSMFYEVYDKQLLTLCEEVTYYNRLEDTEITFVNGIYFGANVESNPIRHRDNEDRPKYNFAVLGYEHISPRFFYYKSAAWKLGSDDELVQRMEQLTVDATFLSVMPPQLLTGAGALNESIMIPGKTTVVENAEARIAPIQIGTAITAGWEAIAQKEKGMSQSTQDAMMQGVQGPQKTALEASILQQNAKVALGLFGNMLSNSLKRFGGLMIDVILQHQTVQDVEEVSGASEKWKTFVLNNVQDGGKTVTKKIIFGEESMTPEQVMEEEGGIDSNTRIFHVSDPEKWRRLKYQIVIDMDELLPKNDIVEKALKQEAYAKLIQNPLVDPEAVTRDFLVEPLAGGDTDKYMKPQGMPMQVPMQPQSNIPQVKNMVEGMTVA